MYCSSTGVNIYVLTGQVLCKVIGAVQCKGGSSWSAHKDFAHGTDQGWTLNVFLSLVYLLIHAFVVCLFCFCKMVSRILFIPFCIKWKIYLFFVLILIQDPSTCLVKKRDITLRCLIEYMGENHQDLISDYSVSVFF